MKLAILLSRSSLEICAPQVRVEVHIAEGLPKMTIVGLAETAVKESKERVRAAIQNSGFKFPASKRITISLAPADLPKEGGRYDLPIALGILIAYRQIDVDATWLPEMAGELALDGQLHAVRGGLPMALAARDAGRALILPRACAHEGALVRDAVVFAADSLCDVAAHVTGMQSLSRVASQAGAGVEHDGPDLADVQGQARAKRALEIAAAGGHSMLMIGPPGTGKTMLAERLPGILPELSEEDALQSAALVSLRGELHDLSHWRRRPFRAPHHTASAIALAGGGKHPLPGELSLAHNGVLFLDELPEFDRRALEVLRQPLESGKIAIARAAGHVEFPARVQLLAAMNPCPCGYNGDPDKDCRCSEQRVATYRHKISGPLLDRIDIHLEVPRAQINVLAQVKDAETSAVVRERVVTARARQHQRGGLNATREITQAQFYLTPDTDGCELLERAAKNRQLSARGQHKVLRLARTIADLAGDDVVRCAHVGEALSLRVF